MMADGPIQVSTPAGSNALNGRVQDFEGIRGARFAASF